MLVEIASDLSAFGAAGTRAVSVEGLMSTFADLRMEKGGGPTGWLNEHLKVLAAPRTPNAARLARLLDQLNCVSTRVSQAP